MSNKNAELAVCALSNRTVIYMNIKAAASQQRRPSHGRTNWQYFEKQTNSLRLFPLLRLETDGSVLDATRAEV